MSLPIPERQGTGLPQLPKRAEVKPEAPAEESWEEVLQITISPSTTDSDALNVTFAAEGFDVSDDAAIIDVLKIALVSYGINTVDE